MSGVRGKIRQRDTSNPFIDSNSVIPGTLDINDLKLVDNGDSSAINAEMLPYEHIGLTPTIHDKIEAISADINWKKDEFVGDGVTTTFNLSLAVNITQPYIIFVSGVKQREGIHYDWSFNSENNAIVFTYAPEVGLDIYMLYQQQI